MLSCLHWHRLAYSRAPGQNVVQPAAQRDPIRPPGRVPGSGGTMADLFKAKPAAAAPVPAASAAPQQPAYAAALPEAPASANVDQVMDMRLLSN